MAKSLNKKKKNNLLIKCIIIVLIIIACIVAIKLKNKNNTSPKKGNYPDYVEQVDEGIRLNRSDKMKEEKKLGNLSFKNVQLTTKNGMTTLLAEVKNTGSTTTSMKLIEVKLLDENGGVLATLTGAVQELEPNKTAELNIAMTSDYVRAYDYSVSEK